jgi:hypothetical protein
MNFECLTDEQLADVWYALAGAEIRHPGCFTALLEQSNDELFRRMGNRLAPFIEERFRQLRRTDAVEDAEATRAASEQSRD